MKLLFYNWVPVDSTQGGGVAVYQRNLLKYLLKNTDHELYFFNSGWTYKNNTNQIMMRQIPNEISEKLKTFEIINSPVLAPVKQSIINIRHYLEDTSLYIILKKFIEHFGVFDAIHFNNLEGLSLNVLKLKELFPKTRFIYSLHNYFLVCSQANLWQTQINVGSHNCRKKSYAECLNCYYKLNYNAEILFRKYKELNGMYQFSALYSQNFPDIDDIKLYSNFEKQNILYSNKYFDSILAVSYRVKEIFIERGLSKEKIQVSYIGTDVADLQKKINCADVYSNPFKIIYIGYMSEDKGFYFFLKSLYEMNKKLSKKIVVTIAARYSDHNKQEIETLKQLKRKFNDIILFNGYKREELMQLLRGQHLGIVPVMWEDNLPQIAIEQIAYGVPVLCSNFGGASELSNHNPDFTFEAGNFKDFLQKIENLFVNRHLLKTYWNTTKSLTTMKEHVSFLENVFKGYTS